MFENFKRHCNWRMKYYLIHLLSLLKNFEKKQRIIVFGSGRSGTNLLASFLNTIQNTVEIEEPLMNSSSKEIDKIGFTGWGQYIPESSDWQEAKLFFRKFFAGIEMNPNHYAGDIWDLVKADYFIYRFIRANLLMPWLILNFDILNPIFLIRNPYAVIASQLQHPGFGGNKPLYLEQKATTRNFKYYKEFYIKYEKKFNNSKRIEEVLIIKWLMENEYVVSHKWHNVKWLSVNYEDLIGKPELVRKKINTKIGLNIPSRANDIIKLPSKSVVTKLERDQIIKHRKYLSEEQADIISENLTNSIFNNIYSF